MILIINICKEKLHYYEFVKPIEDILKKNKIDFFTKYYKEIINQDLDQSKKIIICGTSLYDYFFIEDVKKFSWIKYFNKPILGICGGMQIIGLVFNGKIEKNTEIGLYKEEFKEYFLGINGLQEVYHLHNNHINFKNLKEFEIFSGDKVSQAVKHKEESIYGVLFHPEVRQKEMIISFCNDI
jgi:GMP synthase-like glutamine amidotransferase